jgi:hypothetical protein
MSRLYDFVSLYPLTLSSIARQPNRDPFSYRCGCQHVPTEGVKSKIHMCDYHEGFEDGVYAAMQEDNT